MTLSSAQREWWVVSPAPAGPFDGIADFSHELATAIGAIEPVRQVSPHAAFVAQAKGSDMRGVFLQYSPPAFVRTDVVWLLSMLARLRARGIPVITTVHEYWPPASASVKRTVGRWLYKRTLAAVASRSAGIVTTTPYANRHLRQSGVFGKTPSVVIPVGSNIAAVPRVPNVSGPLTFAIFGQPYVMDRAVVLGFARWIASLPERPRVIWAARSAEELARWWEELGAPEVAEFRGGLSSSDVAGMLAAADVGLALHDDGASTRRSSVAAMVATGLPIVGLYGRFTDDRLRNNPGLLLSPIGDPDALIVNARRVANDAALRQRMSAATAALFATDFSWSRIAAQYLEFARQ